LENLELLRKLLEEAKTLADKVYVPLPGDNDRYQDFALLLAHLDVALNTVEEMEQA